jgi:predicted enzyme related to lactoylglutathione lyase
MTTRDTPFAAGTPCWVDLLSSDVGKSKAFYSELFDWTSQDAGEEFGGYVTFFSDGHPVAGMSGMSPGLESRSADNWNTYISTSDIDASTEAAVEAGGQVVSPPMQVGDLGSMAILSDPAGAMIGFWQPGMHVGFGKYNEPGSVTWDEHHSKDFAASVAFYESVFGWNIHRTSDTDEFRYFEGQVDGQTVAGLMDSASFLPAEVPSHWAVYFSVSDADAAVANAVKLGATVLRAAEDTPFGRMADLRDATGAGFKLHSANLAGGS